MSGTSRRKLGYLQMRFRRRVEPISWILLRNLPSMADARCQSTAQGPDFARDPVIVHDTLTAPRLTENLAKDDIGKNSWSDPRVPVGLGRGETEKSLPECYACDSGGLIL